MKIGEEVTVAIQVPRLGSFYQRWDHREGRVVSFDAETVVVCIGFGGDHQYLVFVEHDRVGEYDKVAAFIKQKEREEA